MFRSVSIAVLSATTILFGLSSCGVSIEARKRLRGVEKTEDDPSYQATAPLVVDDPGYVCTDDLTDLACSIPELTDDPEDFFIGEELLLPDDGEFLGDSEFAQGNPGDDSMTCDAAPDEGLMLDETIYVGRNRVQLPTLKGDRCHAGGASVHMTITDGCGRVYKMVPKADGTWVTVDGRPGPSNNVWRTVTGNPRVAGAMRKLMTRLLPGIAACALTMGYDSYVEAGTQSGMTILDKIKTMRTIQDICAPDENGVIQPILDLTGNIPGGASDGGTLFYEVIWNPQYGWIFTSYYMVDDCSFLERQLGCTRTRKVWVIGPDKLQPVPLACLKAQ